MLLSALLLLTNMTASDDSQPSRIIEQRCAMAVASQIPADPAFKMDSFDLRNASNRYKGEIVGSYANLDDAAKDLNAQLQIFEGEPVPKAPSVGESDEAFRSMLTERLGRAAWNTSEYSVSGHIGIVRIKYRQYCLNNRPKSPNIYVSQKIFEGED